MAGDSSLPAAAGESACALPALAAMESDRGRDCRAAAEAGGGCGAEAAAGRAAGGMQRGVEKKMLGLGLGMARAILGHNRSSAPAVRLPDLLSRSRLINTRMALGCQ